MNFAPHVPGLRDMLWIAAGISILTLSGCATPKPGEGEANKDGSVTVTIPAERVAECAEQGGCHMFTRDELLELVVRSRAAGAKAGI